MASLSSKLCIGGSAWVCAAGGLVSLKVANYSSDAIILGNYEDYMSPHMEEQMGEKYGIRMDYFTHDQAVGDRFRNGIYQMAVVSTSILEELIQSQLVKKLDWSRLVSDQTKNNPKELFTDVVKKIVEGNGTDKFLDYGVPYFMNKLSFCYSGDAIPSLQKPALTWSQIMDEIVKEDRFKPKNGSPKLGLIEDPRTILSLSRFANGETSVNARGYYDAESIYFDYLKLLQKLNKNNMGRNFMHLDGTSSRLVDALVSGGINGAFMYNADCLYASYGGNLGESHQPLSGKLHIVDVANDIYFLDFLVMSSLVTKDQEQRIYEFYKSILMNGHDKDKKVIMDKGVNGGDIQPVSNAVDQPYKYWLTRNFDYVRYTPVIKNLDDGVQEHYFLDQEEHKDFRNKSVKIEFSSGKDIKNHYESHFSQKVKSDMLLAFSRFKDQL